MRLHLGHNRYLTMNYGSSHNKALRPDRIYPECQKGKFLIQHKQKRLAKELQLLEKEGLSGSNIEGQIELLRYPSNTKSTWQNNRLDSKH